MKRIRVDLARAELERPTGTQKQRVARARKVLCGCSDCGYNRHPAALQFDHRPGTVKVHNIAGWPYSLATMIEEMAKCDVVCANCHAIRTSIRHADPSALSAREYTKPTQEELDGLLTDSDRDLIHWQEDDEKAKRQVHIQGRLNRKALRDEVRARTA